ncbi:M50 family metallopeptidase [Glutamicibacter sp. JC586]|uniref:M50 family metallopeptidase n=1 Tax=Glutamicibacter sp. JC586 TaxID=2590552 RepID=UPI0013592D79|nr:M50 family metallopeptidase [Glutamicibacter sp. JC586]
MNVDIADTWHRLAQPVNVELNLWQWLIVLAVVLLAVIPMPIWRFTGLYSTLVHELGHIVSALLTGRYVTGLRLGWNHSGEVVSKGRGKLSVIVSGLFGYPAPLWVSAIMFWAISAGYAGRALGIYALFFLLALVFVRNWPAFVVCALSVVLALAVVFFAPVGAYIYLSLLIAGFLLIAGLRDYIKLLSVHTLRRHDLEQSDAYLIARSTNTFATLWLLIILLLGAIALWFSALSLLTLF